MREDPKFGTDGVRGLANADLSAFFAFRLGRTAGHVISGDHRAVYGAQSTFEQMPRVRLLELHWVQPVAVGQ